MTDLIKTSSNALLTKFTLKEKATNYANQAFSKNTYINYQSDWKLFGEWCFSFKVDPLECDHQIFKLYITHLAEEKCKASTIQRKISAIKKYYKMNNRKADFEHPRFIEVWQGIKRTIGVAKKGKNPILVNTLKLLLDAIPDKTAMNLRDRALLSFGWASAMRRSEITQLNWQDILFIDEGIIITIKQSKTDQFGEGQKIAILYGRNKSTCPVRLLLAWKEASFTNEDAPIFTSISSSGKVKNIRLSDRDVARIIKKWARIIGIEHEVLAGHSLRSGFITTASKNGVPTHTIMKHSRHKDPKMIHVYTRDNSLVTDNATGMVGL